MKGCEQLGSKSLISGLLVKVNANWNQGQGDDYRIKSVAQTLALGRWFVNGTLVPGLRKRGAKPADGFHFHYAATIVLRKLGLWERL